MGRLLLTLTGYDYTIFFINLTGGGPLYTPDAITRTVQIEPAARIETSRPVSASNSQHKAVGPIRPKSSQCEYKTNLNILILFNLSF